MRFLSTTATTTKPSIITTSLRHFRTKPKTPNFSKIPIRYRSRAIEDAQKALTEYLHATRSLPFTYAEFISKNSPVSLAKIIQTIEFSPSTITKSLQKFLRYNPINEFEFFYESIGLDQSEISGFLVKNKFFLAEDSAALNVAFALLEFGFPWNNLGVLYKEDVSIFSMNSGDLSDRLCGFKGYGFSSVGVIGICLAFPYVLSGNCKLGGEIDCLFGDLKRVFEDFDLLSSVEGNVDDWYVVCRKIRVFYDLGIEKGKVGDMLGRRKNIFIDYPEEVLVKKVEFFCRLGVRREEIGLLILGSSEILNFDLEKPTISVLGFLRHFDLDEEKLELVAKEYPYVMGRNRLVNLPHVIRVLDLREWFFDKIKNGNHLLLDCYIIGPEEDMDKDFNDSFEKIQSKQRPIHITSKLDLLHKYGFGENMYTMKVLSHLHGTRSQLEERIECLLGLGIELPNLCKMINQTPKILNQNPKSLTRKLNFLCQDMGLTLQHLDAFPAYLCYELENRIKPRYRFYSWLSEKGLSSINYSVASMIATSDKDFMSRVIGLHPAALKHWFECFSCKPH